MPKTPEQPLKYTTIMVNEKIMQVTVGDTVEIDYGATVDNKTETIVGVIADVEGVGDIFGIELQGKRIFTSLDIKDVRIIKPRDKKKKKK